MTLLAASMSGQTAILECATSSEKGGRVTLTFRAGVAEGMDVARATLLAHLRQNSPAPKRLKVNGRWAAVKTLEQGWISVTVRGRDALKPLVLEGGMIDGPAAPGFAPYLAVEGAQQPKAK
jgi:hypothetical protein